MVKEDISKTKGRGRAGTVYALCVPDYGDWQPLLIIESLSKRYTARGGGWTKICFVSICDNLQHNITKTFLLPYTSAMMQMPPKLVIPNFSEVSVEKNVACLIKFTIVNQMKHCACLQPINSVCLLQATRTFVYCGPFLIHAFGKYIDVFACGASLS